MIKAGPYDGSKRAARRRAFQERRVGRFKTDLARLEALAAQIPDEATLDSFLAQDQTMAPAVKAECRKLILNLMRPHADRINSGQAEPERQ